MLLIEIYFYYKIRVKAHTVLEYVLLFTNESKWQGAHGDIA